MSDDIVTRLREYDFMRDGDTPDMTMAEAADEIEFLRTKNQMLLGVIGLLKQADEEPF
jgi:hypothetical protein